MMSGALLDIKWKQGARFRCKAETAHAALEDLREANDGRLDPHLLVRAATPKKHPLHREFEWNDKRAADLFRRRTASHLIASIEVVREETPLVQSRLYEVTIEAPMEKGGKPLFIYRTTEDILADPQARAKLLNDAVRDLAAFRKRYGVLSELAQLIEGIDALLK